MHGVAGHAGEIDQPMVLEGKGRTREVNVLWLSEAEERDGQYVLDRC